MVTNALESASPIPQKPMSQIALGAFELGEIFMLRSRLHDPRWRLHALLALVSSAKSLGLSTRVMESELRSCLDSLIARRVASLWNMAPLVREHLPTWLGEQPVDVLQDLAAALSQARRTAPLTCLESLLAAGQLELARSFADGWPEPYVAQRLGRLARSGMAADGRRRRFVAPPFHGGFAASLPRYIAMMEVCRRQGLLTAAQWADAEDVLASLGRVDRQTALAHKAAAIYRQEGFSAGVGAIHSIRYKSCRQQAWWRLVQASVEAGRLDDAWRAVARIDGRAWHERARLVLARELVRRGDRSRARRLLCEPFMAPRLEERALLICEIEPQRLSSYRQFWRRSKSGPSEDLAHLEPGIPKLEQRWTMLGLRIALHRELSVGRRFFAAGHLGLWPMRLRRLAQDRVAVRAWLHGLERDGAELGPVLHRLNGLPQELLDSIWGEHLSLCSQAVVRDRRTSIGASGAGPPKKYAEAFSRGLLACDGGHSGASRTGAEDALSAERSILDEGLSWSPQSARRRRVILGACKHCLKMWLLHDAEIDSRALESRLRTLSNLGGTLPTESLLRLLEKVQQPEKSNLRAFNVLIALAPERAARMTFHHHLDFLFELSGAARGLLLTLEDHRALESGFSRAWGRFVGRIGRRFGRRRGVIWLRQWLQSRTEQAPAVPTLLEIECCQKELEYGWPTTGDQLIARARQRLDQLLSLPPKSLPAALLEDPIAIKRLLWLSPSAGPPSSRWARESSWREAIETVRNRFGGVDERMVLDLGRRLKAPGARGLSRRLLNGEHPAVNATRVVELEPESEIRLRLRFLDKRRDLLTFLRFADCVPCCFSSASSDYRVYGMDWWVLALWKDPLSFCFHIERNVDDTGWQPSGFVFGGFGLDDGDHVVILLNGIYLRQQSARWRALVLAGLEESLCRPLGVRQLAIANCHGGRGELPSGYRRRPSRITRLRALRFSSGPVSAIYDDISTEVNRLIFPNHLYWRVLML